MKLSTLFYTLGILVLAYGASLSAAEYSAEPFDRVLQAHVHDGVVNYPAIARDPDFERYVELLSDVNPATLGSQADRLAFWINAYNALAIRGVLNGLSPEGLIGKYRFFYGDKHKVAGRETNLYNLEHKTILPFGEPRVHFALVCASASCPKLRSEVYDGNLLDVQLDEQAIAFINDMSRNRIDVESKTLYLSKIFDWFEDDFEKAGGSLPGYIAWYIQSPALEKELKTNIYEVEFLDYDWSLNGPEPES